MTLPVQISIFILLVLSLGLHEAAHARVASYFGDPTPEQDGVNTWNPIPHILRAYLWCLVIPAILWFFMGFFMGGAYVMLNAAYMRPRRLGYFCAVAAGPGMNLALSLFFGVLFILTALQGKNMYAPLPIIFFVVAQFNLILMIFNLIPIPPLDGSSMLATAVPALKPVMVAMQGFGFIVLFVLLSYSSTAQQILFWPAMQFGYLLMDAVTALSK